MGVMSVILVKLKAHTLQQQTQGLFATTVRAHVGLLLSHNHLQLHVIHCKAAMGLTLPILVKLNGPGLQGRCRQRNSDNSKELYWHPNMPVSATTLYISAGLLQLHSNLLNMVCSCCLMVSPFFGAGLCTRRNRKVSLCDFAWSDAQPQKHNAAFIWHCMLADL